MASEMVARTANIIILLLFIGSAGLLLPGASPAQSDEDLHRMGELSRKMGELAEKFEQCKDDLQCMNRISQEMEALSKQYQSLLPASPQTGSTGLLVTDIPSCSHFFRPGWSCLPVNATVETSLDRLDYDYYCDPPGSLPCNRKYYLGHEYHYRDRAVGTGIAMYTKDFSEFQIIVRGAAAKTTILKANGKDRWIESGWSGEMIWKEKTWPNSSPQTRRGFHLSVTHPASVPGYSFSYGGPDVRSPDPGGRSLATPRLPGGGQDKSFVFTPQDFSQVVKNRSLTKTFRWRWHFQPGEQRSYEETSIRVTLTADEPAEDKPGLLLVAPSGGLTIKGPDKLCRFAPMKRTYTLTNKGKSPLAFVVQTSVDWLSPNTSNGLLDPQASTSVEISADEKKIKAMKQGAYSGVITFLDKTSNRATRRKVSVKVDKEQRWDVSVTGYEIDEMNPYWKQTTKVRGAVRFDWTLKGAFTVFKDDRCAWKLKSGTITHASTRLTDLHEPQASWEIKPLNCRTCDRVSQQKGKPLHGYVRDNTAHLSWGIVKPKVDVHARIKVSCVPQPDCSQWKEREFLSETFLDRINYLPLPLVDGKTVEGKVVSPQESRWIDYKIVLKKK